MRDISKLNNIIWIPWGSNSNLDIITLTCRISWWVVQYGSCQSGLQGNGVVSITTIHQTNMNPCIILLRYVVRRHNLVRRQDIFFCFLSGVKLTFFTEASMALCFEIVLESALITQGSFIYFWAVLTHSSSPHPTSEQARGAQGIGREYS